MCGVLRESFGDSETNAVVSVQWSVANKNWHIMNRRYFLLATDPWSLTLFGAP